MKRFLKTAALTVLALCMVISAVSCAGTALSSESRDGVAPGGTKAYDGGIAPSYSGDVAVEPYDPSYSGGDDDYYESSGKDASDIALGDVDWEGMAVSGEGRFDGDSDDQPYYGAGQMTASAWNDNTYFEAWRELFDREGKFNSFLQGDWNLPSQNRIKVTVTSGDDPVANASVKCVSGKTALFSAVTDATGVAYLFTSALTGTVTVSSGSEEKSVSFDAEQSDEITVDLASSAGKSNLIQLMFVVDVTGSMGDEINFLKSELDDVIGKVATDNKGARIELAFLFYRDDGDAQKLQYVDFKDVTDPDNYKEQQKALASQYADGGGDYPEAVDEALLEAVNQQWSANATKLLFLVLDAPAHSGAKYQNRFSNAVKTAAEMGVRICPILASGADTLCEYITRSAAIYTGGTSVFVTNHSGIGGDHLDPDLPNAVVEYLNALLIRLIDGYYTGTFAAPVPYNQHAVR